MLFSQRIQRRSCNEIGLYGVVFAIYAACLCNIASAGQDGYFPLELKFELKNKDHENVFNSLVSNIENHYGTSVNSSMIYTICEKECIRNKDRYPDVSFLDDSGRIISTATIYYYKNEQDKIDFLNYYIDFLLKNTVDHARLDFYRSAIDSIEVKIHTGDYKDCLAELKKINNFPPGSKYYNLMNFYIIYALLHGDKAEIPLTSYILNHELSFDALSRILNRRETFSLPSFECNGIYSFKGESKFKFHAISYLNMSYFTRAMLILAECYKENQDLESLDYLFNALYEEYKPRYFGDWYDEETARVKGFYLTPLDT